MGSSGMALYLNGVRLVSRTNTTPFNELNAGERNYLGRSNFRAPPFNDSDLDGQMDEVRIWNKARTQSEIQETLFKQLTGKEAGLVGLWNFNDGTARDASTNGFHGQLLGNARILEADYPAFRNGRAFPTVLSGVVTDPLNNPVDGAMILIENPGISTNVIRSDPRGEFGLTLFENGDRFRISASQGDHGFHPTDFELVRGREHALSLKLVYAVSLSGRVLAMDGSPQLNVPVQAFGLLGNSDRVATTHSDKDGHYQFVNLAPGPYRVQCQTLSGMISSSAGDEVVVMDGRTIRNVDFRFMPETQGFLKQFTHLDGLADDVVNCLWIDADDMLWLGTAHGLSRFDGKQFENFTDEDGLNDSVVQALHRDAAGVLWIGTQRGITLLGPGPKSTNSIFQKGIPYNFSSVPELSGKSVVQIVSDAKGVLWAGCERAQGLWRFDGKSWNQFTRLNGLPSDDITHLRLDSKGILWVGTWEGLAWFDGQKFVSMAGLGLEVRSLALDRIGNVWVGTARFLEN